MRGLSLVAMSRGYSSVVVHVFLIAVASVAEYRCYTFGLQYFQYMGSVVASVATAPGL